jgi:hypothetical protein
VQHALHAVVLLVHHVLLEVTVGLASKVSTFAQFESSWLDRETLDHYAAVPA